MATRGTWTISVKSGSVWGVNGTIARPNENFKINKSSTQSSIMLADGSQAFMLPSTKSLDTPLTFIWYNDTGTIKTQVEGYVTNGSNLKITDHNSDIYYGRFTGVGVNWIKGFSTNKYDLQAAFVIMPALA